MPPKKKVAVEDDDTPKSSIFEDCVFALSGSMSKTRAEMTKLIQDNGGAVASSVTKKVTHLVTTADDSGDKLEKAKSNGIPLVNEDFIFESISAKSKKAEAGFLVTFDSKRKASSPPPEEPPAKRPRRAAASKKKVEEEGDDDDDEEEEAKPKKMEVVDDKKEEEEKKSAAKSDTKGKGKKAKDDSDDETEVKVKVIKKGKAPVDSFSGMVASAHVYEDGSEIYDCMLNQTNIGHNNNKFYVIQLLESDSGKEYTVWNRWGRVGERGQNKKVGCGGNLGNAIATFKKKFTEKTGNSWDRRSSFVAKSGKYTLIEIDYGNDDPAGEASSASASGEGGEKKKRDKSEEPASKLDKRVQDIVSLIFDMKMMERTLVEMEFDVKKSPLGKLTKKQIQQGYEVLKEIDAVLKSGGSRARSSLETLTSRFYTMIPHNFGRVRPPIIDDLETLKKKMAMLEALADIEIATKIMKETEDTSGNLIDANFEKLKTKMVPVDKTTDEFNLVREYVDNSQESGRVRVELQELFKIEREGEYARYEPCAKMENRRLLWHGTRLTNMVGILSQGLRIAPPEAPASGYRFGKGLYFADMASLSSLYCRVTRDAPIGIMLLADVALGKMYEAPRDEYMEKSKPGYDSTWAVGTREPDASKTKVLDDGTIVPSGPIVDSGKTSVSCREHQYIVYTVPQARLRYLLRLKWCF